MSPFHVLGTDKYNGSQWPELKDPTGTGASRGLELKNSSGALASPLPCDPLHRPESPSFNRMETLQRRLHPKAFCKLLCARHHRPRSRGQVPGLEVESRLLLSPRSACGPHTLPRAGGCRSGSCVIQPRAPGRGWGRGDYIPTTGVTIGTRTDPPHGSAAPPDPRRLRATAMVMPMTP